MALQVTLPATAEEIENDLRHIKPGCNIADDIGGTVDKYGRHKKTLWSITFHLTDTSPDYGHNNQFCGQQYVT